MKKLLHITFTLVFTLISLLPLAQADEVTYFIPDASGSPVAAMNEAGDTIWRKHYTPFGAEIETISDNRISYTGHVKDQNTGLLYMGQRYYDPVVPQFMSMDPAAINPNDPRTFNRYNYANNNPYRFVDPDGQFPVLLAVWSVMAGLTAIDMMYNPPVPGHEQDGIASVITLPGPIKLGGKVATEAVEQGSDIVAKGGTKEIGTITTRTTKNTTRLGGEAGESGVKITYKNGTEFDMTKTRVKETELNPYVPGGTRSIKYDDALNKQGTKRAPTQEEHDWFNSISW